MKRDPSFPLYAANWLTGEATMAMLPEQEGPFIRLLCFAWLGDPPCTIPNDDKVLAQVSKLGARWKRLGGAVKDQFAPLPDDPTRLRNENLYQIYLEREAYRAAKAENGRKGGRPKATGKLTETETEPNAKPSLLSAFDSSLEREETPLSSNGSRGGGFRSNGSDFRPLWGQAQFQYKADKIAEWTNKVKRTKKIGPGDADFETEFQAAWGMGYEYWTVQREAHETFFVAARGAA